MKFSDFAHVLQELESTQSRLDMTQLLSDVFGKASADEIGAMCYLVLGRVKPRYEPCEFGVARKFAIRAIASAYSVEVSEVEELYATKGDLGDVVYELATALNRADSDASVLDVHSKLLALAEMSGTGSQEAKIEALSKLLQEADGLSAKFLVRIPLEKLRLGFSDMTILDGLSWMLTGDKSLRKSIEIAYNARPDIGFIAQTIKRDGIDGLKHVHVTIGVPVLAALCQRLPTADEMIEKMGEVEVEPKFDGIRVQIHYSATSNGPSIRTYSRNLEDTTYMYPELKKMAGQVTASEMILDAEAVGIDPETGKLLPFQQTTTRKRKHGIEEAMKSVPLLFYVFDLLYIDGNDILQTPLSRRKELLASHIQEGSLLKLSPHIVTTSPDEIRAFHEEQVQKGLEGAVIKKWNGPYEPGRRGHSWVKFKEEEGKTGQLSDTIDAVVMGYYRGRGKRSAFGIGAFLVGVRKGDEIVTLCKIGTGVTDAQWEELLKIFAPHIVEDRPKSYQPVAKTLTPDVWLSPSIIVEIAGDNITTSSTHGAGYAVRFPRLIHRREDKGPSDATTEEEIVYMYKTQSSHIHAK